MIDNIKLRFEASKSCIVRVPRITQDQPDHALVAFLRIDFSGPRCQTMPGSDASKNYALDGAGAGTQNLAKIEVHVVFNKSNLSFI